MCNFYSIIAHGCHGVKFLCLVELKYAASDENPRQFLSMPEEALQMVLSQVTDQNLRHTLQFGIGLHHAGLNDKDRSLVEELFSNNMIQALLHHKVVSFYLEKIILRIRMNCSLPNAGFGLYKHISLGCKSSSPFGYYQGEGNINHAIFICMLSFSFIMVLLV